MELPKLELTCRIIMVFNVVLFSIVFILGMTAYYDPNVLPKTIENIMVDSAQLIINYFWISGIVILFLKTNKIYKIMTVSSSVLGVLVFRFTSLYYMPW